MEVTENEMMNHSPKYSQCNGIEFRKLTIES